MVKMACAMNTSDVFDEFCGDFLGNDMQKLENTYLKAGYREGISDGQEASLQAGFNEGFSDATHQYMATSRLRGCISALLINLNTNQGFNSNEPCIKKLQHCLENLKKLEAMEPEIDRTVIKKINERQEERDMSSNNCGKEDIESTVQLMDCVSLENGVLNANQEINASCCLETDSCKMDDGESKCVCTESIDNSTDTVILGKDIVLPQASIITNSKNQTLKVPFCFGLEWTEIESALNDSGISKDIIDKLKVLSH